MTYRTFSCKWYDLEKQLNAWAKDGWELVTCNVKSEGFAGVAYAVLRKANP